MAIMEKVRHYVH